MHLHIQIHIRTCGSAEERVAERAEAGERECMKNITKKKRPPSALLPDTSSSLHMSLRETVNEPALNV